MAEHAAGLWAIESRLGILRRMRAKWWVAVYHSPEDRAIANVSQ